jgi:hypothetical protein
VVAAFILGRRVLALMVRRVAGTGHRRMIVRCGAAGGFIALLPALLLGTVLGGVFGMAFGERLAPSGAGAAAALAIAQFAFGCTIIVAAVALGGALGNLLGRGED